MFTGDKSIIELEDKRERADRIPGVETAAPVKSAGRHRGTAPGGHEGTAVVGSEQAAQAVADGKPSQPA
jgi:hypothetical protein